MRYFNLFYLIVALVGGLLFYLLRPDSHQELSFYGFAESNETEINYNYPVVVDQIIVSPGQAVQQGEVLLRLTRRKSNEILEDQNYKISELEAEAAIWKEEKKNELTALEQKKNLETAEVEVEIETLKKELRFKKSLSEGLTNVNEQEASYNPLKDEIEGLEIKVFNLTASYDIRLRGVRKELDLGDHPYKEQIRRLNAERAFEESQKIQEIVVTAPADGLIGTVNCKEEEHVPSFSTLLSFYEPHSGLIKGYVHEDLTLQVTLDDIYTISSLKDAEIRYDGKVIGLGSRIVEIPTRLRKIPDIKTYGREVLLEISRDNEFLQKEKVGIGFKLTSNH